MCYVTIVKQMGGNCRSVCVFGEVKFAISIELSRGKFVFFVENFFWSVKLCVVSGGEKGLRFGG